MLIASFEMISKANQAHSRGSWWDENEFTVATIRTKLHGLTRTQYCYNMVGTIQIYIAIHPQLSIDSVLTYSHPRTFHR